MRDSRNPEEYNYGSGNDVADIMDELFETMDEFDELNGDDYQIPEEILRELRNKGML